MHRSTLPSVGNYHRPHRRALAIMLMLGVLTLGALADSIAMEPVERIVAIVGQEPILASELALQIQLLAINQGIRPTTEEEVRQLQEQILQQMISEQLFLIEAKNDTAIRVTDVEIEQALDERVMTIASQYQNEEQFLDELAREGLSFRDFKRRLRPEIENQLYKQKLIQMKLSKISVSRQEVLEFYEQYKDSIPEQDETVRLAHILVTFTPSKTTRDSVMADAEAVRRNAVSGADFATLAMTHSDGPSALIGGDLGTIAETDVLPEFGRPAFMLQPGEISGVVTTPNGLHIIKCESKEGKTGHFRQILFEVNPSPADTQLAFVLADSLLTEINNGTDFRELAKIFSADDDSRKQGGELGWFPLKGLPPVFSAALDSSVNVDDVSGPIQSEYGLHLIKLLDRQEGREISLDDDFDRLKELARQTKTGEYVDQWIEEIRERTYVEIRPLQ